MGGSAGFDGPCPYTERWVADPTMEAAAGRRLGETLGGDFRAEGGLEGFGTRTHLVVGLGALKIDWKLGGER